MSGVSLTSVERFAVTTKRHSYQIINSECWSDWSVQYGYIEYVDLLRVIRKGLAVKNIVDEAIDQCAVVFNLRDSIEVARAMAEETTDERQKRMYASKGVSNCILVYEFGTDHALQAFKT